MSLKVGLVTVTYNSAEVLGGFIESLSKQTHLNHVCCVVDNVSVDNTVEILIGSDYPFHLIQNNENVGVAEGNNQGIEWCIKEGCDLILLINNDTEFEEQLIEKLIQGLEVTGGSIIVPKMNYYFNKKLIWYGGGRFLKWQANFPTHENMDTLDQGQLEVAQIEYAPTCCALIKKEVFSDIGLMERKYFVYFDDTDFFYRVHVHGEHKAYLLPEIEFYHKVGSLTKSRVNLKKSYLSDFRNYYFLRNFIFYVRRQKRIISWLYVPVYYLKVISLWILDRMYKRDIKTLKTIHKALLAGFSH